tara:strand:+ start:6875 stop:7462 length:588 start_codon:yes stop_codon:yes gene_type:complete
MLRKIIFFIVISIAAIPPVWSAESGGMPQLDPEFWVSQIFWLLITFSILFIVLSKFILPKISSNLESRKSQILENIEIADKQKSESQKKLEEFDNLILETKVKAKNIVIEAKTKITEDIKKKRDAFEKEINSEIKIAEDEIKDLMSNSPKKINQIAVDTASDLIKELIGTEVNKSSISAIVDDLSKKDKDKYYGV